jgi:hypothetical protein
MSMEKITTPYAAAVNRLRALLSASKPAAPLADMQDERGAFDESEWRALFNSTRTADTTFEQFCGWMREEVTRGRATSTSANVAQGAEPIGYGRTTQLDAIANNGYALLLAVASPDEGWDVPVFLAAPPAQTVNVSPAAPAQSGEPVGVAGSMPGTDGFTMAVFKASDVSIGTQLYTAPQPAQTPQVASQDDERAAFDTDFLCVDSFAEAMKQKLLAARAKGRSGWQDCDPADLSRMLREHVEKGDPRDVANFCMMLWHLNQPISAHAAVVLDDERAAAFAGVRKQIELVKDGAKHWPNGWSGTVFACDAALLELALAASPQATATTGEPVDDAIGFRNQIAAICRDAGCPGHIRMTAWLKERLSSPQATATLTDEQRDAIEWAAGRAHVASLGKAIDGAAGQRWRVLSDLFRAAPRTYITQAGESVTDGDVACTIKVPPSSVICEVAGVTIVGPADNVAAARTALEATAAPTYPDELTPELCEALGWPNYRCRPVARLFRAAGHAIDKNSEDEQAFVMHWLTKLALRHGENWWPVAREELNAMWRQIAEQQTSFSEKTKRASMEKRP